jgi:hypothetical protein
MLGDSFTTLQKEPVKSQSPNRYKLRSFRIIQILFLLTALDCGIVLEESSTNLSESLLLAGGLIAEAEV